MQMHGAWTDAMDEAQRACGWLSQPPQPAVGMAHYQLGELHRLRGDFAKAEEAYRQANAYGRTPQPGLAQLRLAQGRVDAARKAIGLAVDEAQDAVNRSKALPAFVEIAIAAGDVPAARAAADDLSKIAADLDVPLLQAVAAHAQGEVLYAEGDPRAALNALRRAWTAWCDIDAPYEAARVRVLIGLASRALGDDEGAEMELDAALGALRELGAVPEIARVEKLSSTAAPKTAAGLTAREVEVLALVAAGKTNKAIAEDLVISEKTVARHVSNIFTKLSVSSRSAATAYAYEHNVV
jgi:ATP/maltotriose-dependent transcriptional regulator MalT